MNFGDYRLLCGQPIGTGLLTIDYAATEANHYITGLVFYEPLPNWTYSPPQGYANIAVQGTDASDVTGSTGGYDILATSDQQTVTIGTVTVSLMMPDGNVKLDLINQSTIASSHTITVMSPGLAKRAFWVFRTRVCSRRILQARSC